MKNYLFLITVSTMLSLGLSAHADSSKQKKKPAKQKVEAQADTDSEDKDAAGDPLGESDDEGAPKQKKAQKEQKVIKGAMEEVVCISSGSLHVRSENLKTVLFDADRFEKVKVFQGWGENNKTKTVNGKKYKYAKVQFPSREDGDNSIGWVAVELIKPKSECAGASKSDGDDKVSSDDSDNDKASTKQEKPLKKEKKKKKKSKDEDGDEDKNEDKKEEKTPKQEAGKISGLEDPNCCTFPIKNHPTESFKEGMRRFGANRSGGDRAHAACDLYHSKNDPIISVAGGKVIRDLYFFYQGTYALEVKHQGGFVVRYGEITGKKASGISDGHTVKAGETVGYMGKVDSDCCSPMLHFEMYKGTQSGSLSSGGNKYQRRSDLMNPTSYLEKWESKL